MGVVDRLAEGINLPTMLAAALLVMAVIIVIKIGRVLLTAAIFGAMAAGVSLGQGNPAGTAASHAAIGFGVAAITLFLIKVVRGLLLWVLITALGVAALVLFGFRP
jgi:hypothetical protein